MEYLIGIDLGTSGTKPCSSTSWGRSSPALRWSTPCFKSETAGPSRSPLDWWRLLRIPSVIQQGGVDPGTSRAWGFPARCTAW